jgi:hypothetical protein
MYAFTRPSDQLRDKLREATIRSLRHTSLYRRLILTVKQNGAKTPTLGRKLHTTVRTAPHAGIDIIKFLYGQFYNGKLAYRYGYGPNDACPLCPEHLPDA